MRLQLRLYLRSYHLKDCRNGSCACHSPEIWNDSRIYKNPSKNCSRSVQLPKQNLTFDRNLI
jgi:hypothetical protein